ncbi:antibiotic biosynthesis monooxygenase, partial [Parabacteroides sp. OttesenSCG-928-G07]|nr:antibiotic biosynthesis monooxygenase [Parabacteroides sp. OttesenSCG-928-G07]
IALILYRTHVIYVNLQNNSLNNLNMKKIAKTGLFLSAMLVSLFLGSFTASAAEVAQEEELIIVAHVTVKAQYKDAMTAAFKDVVEGTRKEAGNVSYVLYEHADNPLKFTFVEVWKSQAAIDAHNNSAHFKKFAQILDGKADLEIHTMKKKF